MTYLKKFCFLSFMSLAAIAISISSLSAESVKNIVVIGNKRIDANTIIKKSEIKLNRRLETEEIDDAIKVLMATGDFSDISIKQSGDRAIIKVTEYPRVNQILFVGNKKVKSEDLLKVISLHPRDSFDKTKLKADERTIEEAYNYIGMKNVNVQASASDIGDGRINIEFRISEGKKAKIGWIVFKGNHAFSSNRLREILITKETNILSWLTQSDVYSEERIAADKEILRRFYHTRGYADFRVLSEKTDFIPEKNAYLITFTLDEGARYRFGAMEIESSIHGLQSSYLLKKIKTHPGEIYDSNKIDESVIIINDIVANAGFAFAKIDVHTNHDFNNHTISLTYNIDKGPRVYIERIDIHGNDKTRDYVIRRAFNIGEGDAFNQTMLQRAKRRLDSLGFFQSVNISTSPGSSPDKIILIVDVTEQSTGTFSASAGYVTGGEAPGVTLEASLREANLLGRGQFVRLSISAGQNNSRSYNFSFTEPYFMGHNAAAGFDLFRTVYRMNNEYDVGQTGGVTRLGLPLTDDLGANLSYNYIVEKYGLTSGDYPPAIKDISDKPRTRSSIQYGLIYNTLDNMVIPHNGSFMRVSQELAGIGGEAHFFKTTGNAYFYKTVSEQMDIIASLSFGAGFVKETKPGGALVFDMFKNSNDMIRGFRYNGIGPRQKNAAGLQYFIGGSKTMETALEFNFPVPVLPEGLGIRGALFANAGTIFDSTYKPKKKDPADVKDPNPIVDDKIIGNDMFWRVSTGVSLLWSSPLGPLRFDYAIPIRKFDGDITQNFVFGVSTQF